MDDSVKMVPLKALQEERRKFKNKLSKIEEKIMDEVTIEAPQKTEIQAENDYLMELAELTQNPYYNDSPQKIAELKEYAIQNNTSLKNAYNILFAEAKFEEIKQKAEEEVKNKLNAKQAMAIPALATGSNANPQSKPKLTEAQRESARLYGMTDEEYIKYSN